MSFKTIIMDAQLIFAHCCAVYMLYTIDEEGLAGLLKVIWQQFMKICILILIIK